MYSAFFCNFCIKYWSIPRIPQNTCSNWCDQSSASFWSLRSRSIFLAFCNVNIIHPSPSQYKKDVFNLIIYQIYHHIISFSSLIATIRLVARYFFSPPNQQGKAWRDWSWSDILVDGNQKSGYHQLRLVVYPIIYKDLYIPGGAGFLNHEHSIYSFHPSLLGHWTSSVTIGCPNLRFQTYRRYRWGPPAVLAALFNRAI